jgi:hypothetical protein
MLTFSSTAGENNLDRTQSIQAAYSFGQEIFPSLMQTGNIVPLAVVSQDIPAIFANFTFNRTYCKPSIRLAHADIVPFPLFAGIDYFGAQIEGVEQDRNLKLRWQLSVSDCLGCQFSKLVKRNFQPACVFFFDVQPRAPWYGNATIIQRYLYDSMAGSVLSGGMMVQFTDGLHFLCPLERLCVIDDEKQMAVIFPEQTEQHIQGDLLHYGRTVPDAAPEEFAMICSMGRVSQCFCEAVNRYFVCDSYGHRQSPEVLPGSLGKMFSDWCEKTFEFFGNSADCNHMASPMISFCLCKSYRQSRPFLFDVFSNHKFTNRSV